jgi:nucleotide-binding universal stress UspA family protein
MPARAPESTVVQAMSRWAPKPRQIIVGYDGREASADAVALAIQIAGRTRAMLVLAFAYDESEVGSDEAAARLLRKGLSPVPYGIPAALRAVRDIPAAQLLTELAEPEHADLIVIGSRELGPAGRVQVGSVGRQLLNGAPCAVAIAPNDFRRHQSSFPRARAA